MRFIFSVGNEVVSNSFEFVGVRSNLDFQSQVICSNVTSEDGVVAKNQFREFVFDQ